MLQYYNVMKLKFTINACVINTVKPKYEVVYIQVYGGGMVCPITTNLQRYKIWRLLLNEDSEAFVVSLLLQFV